MPIHFIAGLYHFQSTGARIILVVPSLTPCARPCEFKSLPLHANPPPPPSPNLTPTTTPASPHSPYRYHIYRVCTLLPHPHPRRTSHHDGPPGARPNSSPTSHPLECPRTGAPHPQTPQMWPPGLYHRGVPIFTHPVPTQDFPPRWPPRTPAQQLSAVPPPGVP